MNIGLLGGLLGGAGVLGSSIGGLFGGPGKAPGPKEIARKGVQLRDLYGGRNYAQDVQDSARYNALNQQLNQYSLLGTPGGQMQVPYRTQVNGHWQTVNKPVDVPESQGMLSLLGQAAPQYHDLQMQNDPEGYALLQSLTQDASGLVGQAGASPYEDRLLQQQLRGAQAARGRGYGTSDILNEVLGLDRARQGRRIQAGTYAGGVLGTRQNYMGDPLMNVQRLLGFSQGSMGGPTQQTSLYSPGIAQSQQAAYGANQGNYNSNLNNLTGAFGGLANLGMSSYFARDRGNGGGGQMAQGPAYGSVYSGYGGAPYQSMAGYSAPY